MLAEAPIDIVLRGIGTNGHLAFNDPPADLHDPIAAKAMELDRMCRDQQVMDGCFAAIDDVPRNGITLTLPTLLGEGELFCCVPGNRISYPPTLPSLPGYGIQFSAHAGMNPSAITGRDPRSGDSMRATVNDGIIMLVEDAVGDADRYLSPGFVDFQVKVRERDADNGQARIVKRAGSISGENAAQRADAGVHGLWQLLS